MSNQKSARSQGPGFGPHGGMGAPVQKAKDFKGTLKRLIRYLAPYRFNLLAVFIASILSTVFSILGPKILGMATTKIFEGLMEKFNNIPGAGIDFDYLFRILGLLAGLYLFSSLFAWIQQYIMASVAQKTVYSLREEAEEKIHKLPLKYFDGTTTGETLSRVVNDVDNISTTLQQSLTQIITSVVTIIGIIMMMITISPVMTLILLCTLPLSAVVAVLVAKKSQPYFVGQQKTLGQLSGHVEEIYTGHEVVKAFGHEKKALEKFTAVNEELYQFGWKAQFISGVIMPLMTFVGNLAYVLISIVGGVFVTKGFITIGDIQAFIQYSRQFSHPIAQTANIANIIQSTVASAERVFEFLDEEEQVPDEQEAQVIHYPKGRVSFEHVDFGYTEDQLLIEDMNLEVQPGQTVAIVGPTGAGKTTLVNLLMRFYEINSGTIQIDGVDITKLKRSDLHSLFGMVLQDTWLFHGSIANNIAYGREGAAEEEVIQAALAANADHFIRTLPEGYATILNEDATNISQGQKQLLTIARAILADPPILILDEATSSVDTRTEVHIQKAMNHLMEGRTSFVIAHRLSTIKDADVILVMNEGKVIEQGNHEELLAQNGFYAELYHSQFSGQKMDESIG
ncbi:ABC transporter ATP-binding protein [Niallia endozanthoxylica]|uniref:ABC transporter ATP-binding protein n=1 Tax=Niallia endozanthoxylica TaxID=2036016 RepID=A0A5J5HJL4_9BACI|nr:ABC transporter ATP-binding protein [Niallia endozanthoxylica]KAA9019923.1 ABC transporter ATP-binding protein [Niallia endozanthoxylica]